MFLTCNQMEPWFGMLEVVLAEWLRRKSLGFRNGEVLYELHPSHLPVPSMELHAAGCDLPCVLWWLPKCCCFLITDRYLIKPSHQLVRTAARAAARGAGSPAGRPPSSPPPFCSVPSPHGVLTCVPGSLVLSRCQPWYTPGREPLCAQLEQLVFYFF